MIGSVVLLLFIVMAIFGGVALWVQRSPSQRRRAGDPVVETRERRISLATEAVGYVGTILVLAGATVAVGQRWADIGTWGRLAILVAATLIFFGIGWFIRSSTEPAFQRLTSVTWAVSTVAFAGSAAVVNQFYEPSAQTAFLTIAVTTTVYAAVLWSLHQHALQQAVLFLGVLLSVTALIVRLVHQPDAWMIAVPLWAIGVAWAAGGWWRRINPWFVAVPLGLLVALFAPASIDQPSALRFGLGLGTAATVMALSVIARFTPGLAMASVALLGYVIGAMTYYFADTLGVPASLTIAGLLILILAAVATRWHWFSSKQPPSAQLDSSISASPQVPLKHRHAA